MLAGGPSAAPQEAAAASAATRRRRHKGGSLLRAFLGFRQASQLVAWPCRRPLGSTAAVETIPSAETNRFTRAPHALAQDCTQSVLHLVCTNE